jgi:peptidoglycan/xylan/chitin deacetylase (PgdA/CDA1 family)
MSNPRVPFQMSSERVKLLPLKGKSIIVHVVVNVEYWPFDQPMPRKVLSTPHGVERIPDIPNYSWAEYGLRCGMPRLMKLFARNNLPVSVNINAAVIDIYPSLAKAMRDAGWEFICHGMTQRLLHVEKDEAATIRACISKVRDFVKKKPRGWMGPGFAETFDTPDILKAADIEYILDWTIDDIPCWMTTKHGPIICMPYGTELNDSLIYAVEQHSSAEVLRRFKDTLSVFESELDENPKILTIPLHPHITGVPHRIPYLQGVLDLLRSRDDVVFVNGSEIADWYAAQERPQAH